MRSIRKTLARLCLVNIPCLHFGNANGHWDGLGNPPDAETSLTRHARKSDIGRPFQNGVRLKLPAHYPLNPLRPAAREWLEGTAKPTPGNVRSSLFRASGQAVICRSVQGRRNALAGRCAATRTAGCKSGLSLCCGSDARLWSVPNAGAESNDERPPNSTNRKARGVWGTFALVEVSFTDTVFGE